MVNLEEVLGAASSRLENIKAAQKKCAVQQGITAKQTMQNEVPPHVVTGHWQKSINYHVEELSDLQVQVTVGSNGAERYYYIQEALNHPIEIGWHKAQPELTNIYQRGITEGLLGRSVTQNVGGSGGMGTQSSGFDEFSMMGGMM